MITYIKNLEVKSDWKFIYKGKVWLCKESIKEKRSIEIVGVKRENKNVDIQIFFFVRFLVNFDKFNL